MLKLLMFAVLAAAPVTASHAGSGGPDAVRAMLLARLERVEADEKFKKPVRDALNKYCDGMRSKAFDAGLALLRDDSADSDAQDDWTDHFTRVGSEANKLIADLVKDEMPLGLRIWLDGTAGYEAQFWKEIAEFPLAAARDRLAGFRETFAEERQGLTDKWRQTTDRDRSIDSLAKAARAKLTASFDSEVAKIASKSSLARRAFGSAVRAGDTLFGGGCKPLSAAMDRLDAFTDKSAECARKLREAYRRGSALMVMFANTRNSVKCFLQEVNMSEAEDVFKQASSEAKSRAAGSGCMGEERKADATSFAGAAIAIVEERYREFEGEYEKFIDEFKDIFIGSPGEKTIEELIERKAWQRYQTDLARRSAHIDATLRTLQRDLAKAQEVDLDALDKRTQREIEKSFKRELRRLHEGIKKNGTVLNDIEDMVELQLDLMAKAK